MAEHGWSVLCTRPIIDGLLTNQVSLIDTVDIVWIESPEAEAELAIAKSEGHAGIRIPANLCLVSWWFRSDYDVPEMADGRARLLDPNGQIVLANDIAIDMVERPSHRHFWRFNTFPLSAFGVYWLTVEMKAADGAYTEQARLPLRVMLREVSASSTEPAPPSSPPPPVAPSSAAQRAPSRPSTRRASPKRRRRGSSPRRGRA